MFNIVKRWVKGFIRWFKRVILRQRPPSVKPSGTVSLILGSTSGIEPQYDRVYVRRVQPPTNPCREVPYDGEAYATAFLKANYPTEFAACQRKVNDEN